MDSLFNGIYKNKKVLVTGHTGFKGSWLCYWLKKMGAEVIGYSLEPSTNPNHISLLSLDIISNIADIRDSEMIDKIIKQYQPDIVFHLAAQPLVRYSYENPIETYETNVLGTLKVLEACRKNDIKAIVNITSDKAYENKEWVWRYRENDTLGGYDPYSSSKACADILVNSYRNSYFNTTKYKQDHNTLIASCRAGNVIGGGDWAKDRLFTDIVLSIVDSKKVYIRSPYSTRPWQHVLEALSGYLNIGQKLLEEKIEFSTAWNFGPSYDGDLTVEQVVKNVKKYWDKIDYEIVSQNNKLHEADLLRLDCSKANSILKWYSVWDSDTTFEKTTNWYKSFYENNTVLTDEHLNLYVKDAKERNINWAI